MMGIGPKAPPKPAKEPDENDDESFDPIIPDDDEFDDPEKEVDSGGSD